MRYGRSITKKAPLPEPVKSCGGDEGDRTLDLLDATEALSQLSYVPRTSEYISNHSHDVNGKIDIFFRPTPPTSMILCCGRRACLLPGAYDCDPTRCDFDVRERSLPRYEKTAPHFTKMNPPLQGGCPHRAVPASLTTKDTCTVHDCAGSLNKRDGSPSCSAGGGTPSSYGMSFAIPVLT